MSYAYTVRSTCTDLDILKDACRRLGATAPAGSPPFVTLQLDGVRMSLNLSTGLFRFDTDYVNTFKATDLVERVNQAYEAARVTGLTLDCGGTVLSEQTLEDGTIVVNYDIPTVTLAA